MCLCVHLDGRKDKMNRGAAAVYLHGISPFKHKHKNNTIKLPWWAICYCNILLSAPAALLCFERTTERKMEIVSLVPLYSLSSLIDPFYRFLVQQNASFSLLGGGCLTFSDEFTICCQVDL